MPKSSVAIYEEGFSPTEDQRKVIETHEGDIQVVACAGSGKTESISRRVAEILRRGGQPEEVVAFTFTEKAAAELKDRVSKHVCRVLGEDKIGLLGRMFIGTIHAYCFRMLSEHHLEIGNYDVLDENTHAAFVNRHRFDIGFEDLAQEATGHRVYGYAAAEFFLKSVDAVGNELISDKKLSPPAFAKCYKQYRKTLQEHKLLTFGLIIAQMVEMMEQNPEFRRRVRRHLKHLVVDEYQDINPAQERLIELLSANPLKGEHPVQLCVVGDDDQAIYQWRGSDVGNILEFTKRRQALGRKVTVAKLVDNRRSLSPIVKAANRFAGSISGRLEKEMHPVRGEGPKDNPAVICWSAENCEEEGERIAKHIKLLHAKGLRYADIAILLRSVSSSAGPIAMALEAEGIPVSFAGRSGLFDQPEIAALGMAYVWVAEAKWPFSDEDEDGCVQIKWREIKTQDILQRLEVSLRLTKVKQTEFGKFLHSWKDFRTSGAGSNKINMVEDLYLLIEELGLWTLDPDAGPEQARRLGSLGVFSQILADYESVAARGRRGSFNAGEPDRFIDAAVYNASRRAYFWKGLASYISAYAQDNYADFAGEAEFGRDEIQILTVHQAKGLEWPVVFVPSLTNRRFPSSKAGNEQLWLLGEKSFSERKRARYEGGDNDERRLFYVAMTRARDGLYLSYPRRKTNAFKPSPYLGEVAGGVRDQDLPNLAKLPLPTINPSKSAHESVVQLSYSDVASHDECGYRYRLASVFGFKPSIAQELGYGKSVHHVMRALADYTQAKGRPPIEAEVKAIVQREMFVPYASRPSFEAMLQRAEKVALSYVRKHSDDLQRVWATERPFEIRFPKLILSGRADVILDKEGGYEGGLAIVDYKVSTDVERNERYARQLQVYAAAGRAEGLKIEALYLHAIKGDTREVVASDEKAVAASLAWLNETVDNIAKGRHPARGTKEKCGGCDFRWVCKSRKCTP
jgi:DNA helicase-2/ATP-dependent DNA helicase PcrA